MDGIKNGRLLTLAQEQFDVFITGDLNLSFQQNVREFSISIVVLHAEITRLIHTKPLMPKVLLLIAHLKPGEVFVVKQD